MSRLRKIKRVSFTNGALTPNYAAHASPSYPAGAGNGTGYFTITSGQVVVDQLRIQMWDASQTTLLFEAFLPVYYRFRSATNSVTDIEFTPDTPNVFKYGQNVELKFNYTTSPDRGQINDSFWFELPSGWTAAGSQLPAGPFQVAWTGTDPDGDPLTYSLLYSNDGGASWQALATSLVSTSLSLNTNQLPGGSGLLRVVASEAS